MTEPTPSITTQHPTYRIRKERRGGVEAASFRNSLTAVDDATQRVLATCDLRGRALTSELEILDAAHAPWRLTPNRVVLPSRWTLTDMTGRTALEFDGQVGRKLLTPMTRTALAVRDGASEQPLRLVDTTSSFAALALGFNPGDWSLLRGDEAVAKLTLLPSPRPRGKGLRAWLLHVFTPPDRGVVSFGEQHVMSAPAALAMVALFEDLTNAPG